VHTEGHDEFFDLASDPLELTNLTSVPSPRKDAMKAEAERLFRSFQGAGAPPVSATPDALEELKALGYVN
jgi:hypothetical protein